MELTASITLTLSLNEQDRLKEALAEAIRYRAEEEQRRGYSSDSAQLASWRTILTKWDGNA